MDGLITIIAAFAAFAVTFAAGRGYGLTCRKAPPARYWIANGVGMFAGGAVAVAAGATSQDWLWMTGVAIMAGSVTGLKWGLGKVVGTGSLGPDLDTEIDDDED